MDMDPCTLIFIHVLILDCSVEYIDMREFLLGTAQCLSTDAGMDWSVFFNDKN